MSDRDDSSLTSQRQEYEQMLTHQRRLYEEKMTELDMLHTQRKVSGSVCSVELCDGVMM